MLGIVVYFKMVPQRDTRLKVSALLRVERKVTKITNLAEVSGTTVYAIKKHMGDGEGVNRHADSGRKSVVDCDSLRDAIQSSSSNCIAQAVLDLDIFTVLLRRHYFYLYRGHKYVRP